MRVLRVPRRATKEVASWVLLLETPLTDTSTAIPATDQPSGELSLPVYGDWQVLMSEEGVSCSR